MNQLVLIRHRKSEEVVNRWRDTSLKAFQLPVQDEIRVPVNRTQPRSSAGAEGPREHAVS